MNEQNTIPLPGEEEARIQKMETLRPFLLDPQEDYPEPYHILEYNGVPFSKVGGLAAISGQKKNGKSFVLTQLMAAILGDGGDRQQLFLPGLKVPERTIEYLGHLPSVLYVDTEMEKLSSAKVLRRVHWLCEWDMKERNDRFSVLWLKNMPRGEDKPYKKRYDLIRMAVDVLQPDVMFIDGLRDLLGSINDEESGVNILNDLGSMAEEKSMSIWCALHQNPRAGGDGEESKMRGWIGTELGNKVSDTLVSTKTKNSNGVTFTVKHQDARDKDLDDWKFVVTDDAGNLGIPKITGTSGNVSGSVARIEGDPIEEVERWLREARDTVEWPATRQAVKEKIIRDYGGQSNKPKQDIDLQMLLNKRLLINSSLKLKGHWLLVPNDDDDSDDMLPEPPKGDTPF